MKINKINIIAFGGLKNFSLDFNSGFNCIFGENEHGKTTILSFIKMMFYGSERAGSQISKNIRKKYTPWDGSQMAGSIEFENNGRKFRLEREFRSSNTTDKVSLTDLSLGEKQTVSGDIGTKLFGLSAAAFERSIFIGQLGYPSGDTAAEGEINAKLSNMISTGDESVSLDLVKNRLEKARFAIISKSGKAGEYYKNSQLALQLKTKLENSQNATEKYIIGKENLTAHKAQTEKLIKKAQELKLKLSKEEDIKNAAKLEELLETKAQLEKLKSEFILKDGTVADENYLRRIKFCISKLEDSEQKLNSKKNEAQIIKNQIDQMLNAPKLSSDESVESLSENLVMLDSKLSKIKAKIEETENKFKQKTEKLENAKKLKSKPNITLAIIGIILLITGIAFLVLKPIYVGVSGTVLGAVLTILGFSLKKVDINTISALEQEINAIESTLETQKNHQNDLNEQILNKKSRLDAIKISLNTNSTVIENQRKLFEKCETEISALENEKNEKETQLGVVLEDIGITELQGINKILDQLGENFEKQKELKQHINFLLRDLNNISYEQAEEKLAQIKNNTTYLSQDFSEIKSEYEGLINKISDRKALESGVEAEIKSIISTIENPEILKKRLKELEELLSQQEAFCQNADIALEVLNQSFAELRTNYGSQLEKCSAEIFEKLTKGKYSNMTISRSFNINVQETENPISRETDYLSSGTVDQAYLSLRLAVANLISQESPLPLFLDDSLTQYDDTRAKTALEFLNNYAKDGQIIMFTCHKTISDYSKEIGSTVKQF